MQRWILPVLSLALFACDAPPQGLAEVQADAAVEPTAKDPESLIPVQEEDSWEDPAELLEETGDTGDDTGEETPEETPDETVEETEEPLECTDDNRKAWFDASRNTVIDCKFECDVAHNADWESNDCDVAACKERCDETRFLEQADIYDACDDQNSVNISICLAGGNDKKATCLEKKSLIGCRGMEFCFGSNCS